MLEVIETIYKGGVFVPEKTFDLPEGTRVKIVIDRVEEISSSGWNVQEHAGADSEERKKTVAKFLERTGSRIISEKAPHKLSREELHERR